MKKFSQEIYIGKKRISNDTPTYIIAEIGSNHNQSLETAKEMIDAAAECGADAAKFQSLKFDALYKADKTEKDLKSLFELIELSEDWYTTLAAHCFKRGIHFLSAPTYLEAVKLLANAGSPAFKIASPQFDLYPEIILESRKYDLPLIMSVGISSIGDIDRIMKLCEDEEIRDIVLLHCVTQYPTPAEHANLSFIKTLRNLYQCLVGYSDHTLGIHFPVSAVALGASVIEKHFTLDKKSFGPDHHFAIEPVQFKQMVDQIRELKVGMGNGTKASLTSWEVAHRARIEMKFIAKGKIAAGSKIKRSDFTLKRGSCGIARDHFPLIEKFKLNVELVEDEMLEWRHLNTVLEIE